MNTITGKIGSGHWPIQKNETKEITEKIPEKTVKKIPEKTIKKIPEKKKIQCFCNEYYCNVCNSVYDKKYEPIDYIKYNKKI